MGRVIVTYGDFTAYVCDSAATRSSSQITLGRLVVVAVVVVASAAAAAVADADAVVDSAVLVHVDVK